MSKRTQSPLPEEEESKKTKLDAVEDAEDDAVKEAVADLTSQLPENLIATVAEIDYLEPFNPYISQADDQIDRTMMNEEQAGFWRKLIIDDSNPDAPINRVTGKPLNVKHVKHYDATKNYFRFLPNCPVKYLDYINDVFTFVDDKQGGADVLWINKDGLKTCEPTSERRIILKGQLTHTQGTAKTNDRETKFPSLKLIVDQHSHNSGLGVMISIRNHTTQILDIDETNPEAIKYKQLMSMFIADHVKLGSKVNATLILYRFGLNKSKDETETRRFLVASPDMLITGYSV